MHNAQREDELEAIMHAVQRLAAKYPHVPESEIRQLATDEFGRYDGAHVRDFVPVLVERAVAARLREGLSAPA